MTSKTDHDFNPLEDLPPPSYAQATATSPSQPNSSSDSHAALSHNRTRSVDPAPNMAVSAAQASLAATQNASQSMPYAMNSRDPQYGPGPIGNPEYQGPGFMSQPQRGPVGGNRYDHGPGGIIMGHPGDRPGMAQGPYQASERNWPDPMYGPTGMMDSGYGYHRGPLGGGLLMGGRGGGLLGRGGHGYLGGIGGHREGRAERRWARREARWERRGF